MSEDHEVPLPAPALRVVRLAPWLLEAARERPGQPWDEWVSSHEKRKGAERAARELANG
jgi:hypothetical protein